MTYSVAAATKAEREYYEKTLYPLQDKVLAAAGDYGPTLVLTGGTALARVYFDHRYSDDIDLFVGGNRPAQPVANDFLRLIAGAGLEVERIVDQPGFVRSLIGPEKLQVDIASDMPRIDEPIWDEKLHVWVHTVSDLGGNKVAAYESRAEIKDVLDLYYLSQTMTWPELFAVADRKRIPIAYESLRMITSQPITGAALTKSPVDFDLDAFLAKIRAEVTREVKKKELFWSERTEDLVSSLLWDAPHRERRLSDVTRPVLARRAERLSEPERNVMRRLLAESPPVPREQIRL
jgi:hypothetical protein